MMKLAAELRRNDEKYIREMQQYVERLKAQGGEDRTTASKDARNALVRTGVLTQNGRAKKKIVTWE